MKYGRLLILLVVINLACLGLAVARGSHPPDAPAGVLRGRALELVDEQGRVRAELKVLPAQPNLKMPDGTVGYPETVQLRLFTSKGGPYVKLAAMEDGGGLVLGGDSGYLQLLSRGKDGPFIKLVTKDGREKAIKP
jgi:hypothetical protein